MLFPVTHEDVADRWRPLSAAEQMVATYLLGDAETLLLLKRPDLPSKVVDVPANQAPAAGVIPLRLVKLVLADMVQAVLRNPDVQSSIQLSSDGSIGSSWPSASAQALRPRMMVTAEHLESLHPAVVAVPSAGTGWYSVPYA
jgi:hypothetical protein